MKKIIFGDLHGCLTELEKMMSYFTDQKIYDAEKDMLVFLGDYIDRGENPYGVIKKVRELQAENKNVIALKGNHEDMALNYINKMERTWLFNGYDTTINSYCL